MEGLWKLSANAEGIEGFVRDLGYDLQKELKSKEKKVELEQSRLDKDTGFILYWKTKKHYGEIMITESRRENGILLVERFEGISSLERVSLPGDLRNAAEIYDNIDSFLQNKYGKPTQSHARETYKAVMLDVPI